MEHVQATPTLLHNTQPSFKHKCWTPVSDYFIVPLYMIPWSTSNITFVVHGCPCSTWVELHVLMSIQVCAHRLVNHTPAPIHMLAQGSRANVCLNNFHLYPATGCPTPLWHHAPTNTSIYVVHHLPHLPCNHWPDCVSHHNEYSIHQQEHAHVWQGSANVEYISA